MSNILLRLKNETSIQHRSVEEHLPFFKPEFDLKTYALILCRFYRFHLAFENALLNSTGLKEIDFNYAPRAKLPWLKQDLTALNSSLEIEPASISLDYTSLPRALGGLYVIEGSTLGGKIISTHLNKTIGLSPENGGRYFYSYGERRGEMWKDVQALLLRHLAEAEAQEQAVVSAQETFKALEHELQR